MSDVEREWVIECRPTALSASAGQPVNPFDAWLTWPIEKDQIIVNTEDGRTNWIITRMEVYGEPSIRTPFMIGWTSLPAMDIRLRKRIGER